MMIKNTSFWFLWAGQSLALFGDVLYIVALVTLIYQYTGTATYTAMVPIVRVGSLMISGILAPLIIDRYRLHQILIFSLLGQTILILLLTLFNISFHPLTSVFPILLFVVGISFLEGWAAPVRNSLVPRLVNEDQLVKANGYLATTDQTVQFVGWAIGGTLIAIIGPESALWITLGLFVLSMISLYLVRVTTEPQKTKRNQEITSKWKSIREGWHTIWKLSFLRTIILMEIVEGIGNGAWIGAILLVYVKQILHRGEEWWGFINASYLAGSILGGVITLMFSRWINQYLGLSVIIGALGFGLFTFAFGQTTMPWIALVLSLLMGPTSQVKDIAKRTLFQQNVQYNVLPKVFSAHGTVLYSTFGISVVLMAYISDHFGVKEVFFTSAALYGVSVLIGTYNWKSFRSQEGRNFSTEKQVINKPSK